MKRTGIALCLALVMLLAACGANGVDVSKLEKSQYNAADKSTSVTMTLDETTVAKGTETLTFHLVNSSDTEYTFGLDPHLDVEAGGVWYTVPTVEGAVWIEIAYVLQPNSSSDYDFSLKTFYGDLGAGHYRVVRPLYSEAGSTFTLAEFTIE